MDIQKIIEQCGGTRAISDALHIKQPSIYNWKRVPATRVLEIEVLSGISRHTLRPDVFGDAPK
jgi:DNA-binding transcriptional regulator YdaS (Cro superfamily)